MRNATDTKIDFFETFSFFSRLLSLCVAFAGNRKSFAAPILALALLFAVGCGPSTNNSKSDSTNDSTNDGGNTGSGGNTGGGGNTGTGLQTATDGSIIQWETGFRWQATDTETLYTWDEAVNYCANLNIHGQSDWRLPSGYELFSLTDPLRENPSAEPILGLRHNGAESQGRYWSADTSDSSNAWFVAFGGPSSALHKSSQHYVRCVRGNVVSGGYETLADGSIRDKRTGLIWEKAGGDPRRKHDEAQQYCEGLNAHGRAGWRWPTIVELASLIDRSAGSGPYSNSVLGINSTSYWSSSVLALNRPQAWYLSFGNGTVFRFASSDALRVRCVRSE